MSFKIYNTMSRTIENFEPRIAGEVGLYACGFTAYDFTHLGHLRKYTFDDVLVRALRHQGLQVKFVQNVTDVGHLVSDADEGEDKLEKGARKYGKSVWDVAKEFEEYFWRSMDLMGNVRPDVSCRATDHIAEQLEMVKELERRGYTYVIEGDGVYFDTSKLEDYGKLARLDIKGLQAGATVEMVAGKRNPTDFALWKFERPGENRAMSWPSPWAERSFPGWHIECSAMAIKYLGEQFDIHTGGIDHIPVHHTNEIAQAEAATGKEPFVKYWVHHNFLRIDNEKMSKSLGNFYTIDDILKKGFDPKALRLLLLMTHYRSEMNFTWESLAGAQQAWEKLVRLVAQLRADATSEKMAVTEWSAYQRFFEKIEDDLNTPEALAVLWEVTKDKELSAGQKWALLKAFDEVLGLGLETVELPQAVAALDLAELPDEVKQLVEQRDAARRAKDWTATDHLRDQLATLGYQVIDTDQGQQLKRV
jgi:cysteinyl-tRNA synthetase